MEDLNRDEESLKSGSLLWLDFETSREEGCYYSIGIPGRTYGLIWPDRSIQPELWQMKKSPQPVAFTLKDLEQGIIEITNRFHFRNLQEVNFMWELRADGVSVQEGTFHLDLEPGQQKDVHIPYKLSELKPGSVYHLLVSGSTGSDMPWAEAGHELAWEQFEFPLHKASAEPEKHAMSRANLPLELIEHENSVEVKGTSFSYIFDRQNGDLSSMTIAGKDLVSRGLRVNVWRAPLANDLDSWNFWRTEMGHVTEGMGKETANGWRSIGLDQLEQVVDLFRSEIENGKIRIYVEASLQAMNHTTGFKVFYDYSISGDGEIELACRVSARGNMTKWIPRVGLQMELPDDFQEMEWFGRGPFENYPDRKTGAKTGIYQTTVEEDYVPYIIPQDYGNRCDVHWFELRDGEGRGLHISADQLFNVSAQKYSTDMLDRAHYPFQLEEEGLVTLNLDHRVTGVGGTANSVLNPYRVAPGEFEFTFTLKPLMP
jgi:beta-galactosidase